MFLLALIPFFLTQAPESEGRETKPPVVITVCEALCNSLAYEGLSVYIVGRLQTTSEGVWLSQEKCPCSLTVNGENRDTSIALRYEPNFSQEGEYPLVRRLASEKLKEVQATTHFGEGDYEAVAFGEFRSVFGEKYKTGYANRPKYGQGRMGFGHLAGAPAALFGNSVEGLGKETIKMLK